MPTCTMTLLRHLNIGASTPSLPPTYGSTTTAGSGTWEVLCKPLTIQETHTCTLLFPPMQYNPIRRAYYYGHM